jgi:hypothetical protein
MASGAPRRLVLQAKAIAHAPSRDHRGFRAPGEVHRARRLSGHRCTRTEMGGFCPPTTMTASTMRGAAISTTKHFPITLDRARCDRGGPVI